MWDTEPVVLDLSDVVRLSDDDVMKISAANPDLRIEQNASGELEIMAPSGLSSSALTVKFIRAVEDWNVRTGRGIVFDSSAGFRLANGSLRAPDVAWLERAKWDGLTSVQRDGFAPVAPDFVVEIRSPSDHLPSLDRKMGEWIANGCRLAWLVDPIDEQVRIYRVDGEVDSVPYAGVLSGEDVLAGFEFDLDALR